MPSNQAIRAGRAFVELFADDSKLVRALRRAQRKLKRFGNNVRALGLKVAGIGSAVLAPLAASAKVFSGYGDQVAKMAKRTGLSVEALSELQFVASQTGTDIGSLEVGLRRMQRSIYDAGRGLSTATDALSDLGLQFSDLSNLAPEDQFRLLTDRISKVEDPTKKAAIAMTLFGRQGTALLPMMANGAKGIDELRAKARELGLTMSGKDAKSAENFTDALDRLWKTVKMGMFRVGAALAPTLISLADTITRVVVTVGNWIKENRQIVVSIAKVAAIVAAGGIALVALGTALGGVGVALGGLITIVTTVSGVLSALFAVIGALVSPIGLVIAAVAALGAYLVYATGIGAKALKWLGDKFNVLKGDALSAYQGIADALAAGDISGAAKILWLSLKMEWTRGINFLEKAWLSFRNFFIKIGYGAWHGMLALVETVWGKLESGWTATTSFFSNVWDSVAGFFMKSWEKIKAKALKAWNYIKSIWSDDTESADQIEQDKNDAIKAIDEQQAKAQAARERDLAKQKAEHEATLAAIGQQNLDKNKALDADYAKRIAANNKELTAARSEWNDALAAARDKRKTKEAEATGPEKPQAPSYDFSNLLDGVSGLGTTLSDHVAKIGARGTFSAAALVGLQSGGATDRMANGIDKIERNTRSLRDAEELAFT